MNDQTTTPSGGSAAPPDHRPAIAPPHLPPSGLPAWLGGLGEVAWDDPDFAMRAGMVLDAVYGLLCDLGGIEEPLAIGMGCGGDSIAVGQYSFTVRPMRPRSVKNGRAEATGSEDVAGHLHICVMDQSSPAAEVLATLIVTDDDARQLATALLTYFNGPNLASMQTAHMADMADRIGTESDTAMIAMALTIGARWESATSEFCVCGIRYSTELDASGIPVMTNGMRRGIARAIARATGDAP